MSFHVVSVASRFRNRLRMVRPTLRCPVALLGVVSLWTGAGAAPRIVDHGYSPLTWHSALALPDDGHKPLVDERGALLYDFGPGPYAIPLTTVGFALRDQPLAYQRQWLDNPRVPLVRTTLAAEGKTVEVTTLSVPPANVADSNARFPRYERLDGISGALGWAQPTVPCSPEFRNVAWGTNRPVRYRVRVEPGARKRVVLGFCESYKPRVNERVAEMIVEGASTQVADLALTAPRNAPQVFLFEAADANDDGWIDITVQAPQGKDPNATLAMIALYPPDLKFTQLTRDVMIAGSTASPDLAELRIACGTEMLAQPSRVDAQRATFPPGVAAVLEVRTGRDLHVDAQGGLSLALNHAPFVATQPRAEKVERTPAGWRLHFPAGTARATALVFSGAPSSIAANAFDFDRAAAELTARWTHSDVPFGHVTVGDPAIQRIVDESLRTVYQARERINGVGQFDSSFTLYRGLWTHDAIYELDLATLLGDFAHARETLDTIYSFQNPRGLIEELAPLVMYRAAPLAFWSLERYARTSGDWASVERHWPAILRGVQALRAARDSTLAHPEAANAGLLPAGFNDGGIADIGSEYSSIYWAVNGLRAATRAGKKIGHADEAAAIEQLANEFFAAFQKAAARDMRADSHGNHYLPVRVGLKGPDDVPPVAQWAVLEHHILGEGLPLDSELMRGTLAMLESYESQGLPRSTGWLPEGIWAGYGALYAQVPLLLGRHEKTADLLYAVANHASPLGGWVEEQSQKNAPPKLAGDQPHCWAATMFVRLAAEMLACERAGELHLLLAVPPEWLQPGMINRLDNVHLTGGPLTLSLVVSADGKRATLNVSALEQDHTLLHTASLQAAGFRLEGETATPDTIGVKRGAATTLQFVR